MSGSVAADSDPLAPLREAPSLPQRAEPGPRETKMTLCYAFGGNKVRILLMILLALCCSGLGPWRPRGEPQTADGPARVCWGLGDAPVKRHRVSVQGLTASGSSSQPLTFADRDVVVATSGFTGIRQEKGTHLLEKAPLLQGRSLLGRAGVQLAGLALCPDRWSPRGDVREPHVARSS
ncbi:unnamed protein product [Rangifer tarandus platyrhynchus]|uniref:Uncharacterized protein n=1 Tax=Rangifer tarandus platyrhynchus TaxID=3082113 RepID=A0ABN8YA43_RANTA|nr:unnamed protein product [Rangifer tarandus platyrhynchus]